ncbi:MAG: hypothetical protein JO336_11675 [Acidobacteriia bacterium]|nr:hypothetical protein [Terriglobia bacterium]MBV8906065.1 hypothetical protein [Terriglobia bacterium]
MDDDGVTGFEGVFDHANEVLPELVSEGVIRAEERARMAVAVFARKKRDLLAPFEGNGKFHGLVVERYEMNPLADAAWGNYERDGDRELLATTQALFFRATFLPSLITSLDNRHDAEARRTFCDRMQQKLTERIRQQPHPVHTYVQMIVLAKEAARPE